MGSNWLRFCLAGALAVVIGIGSSTFAAQDDAKNKGKTKTQKTDSKPKTQVKKGNEDPKANESKGKATGRTEFEMYKDRGGKYRFRMKGPDGEILCMAKGGYETKEECMKVITAIKKDAGTARVEEAK